MRFSASFAVAVMLVLAGATAAIADRAVIHDSSGRTVGTIERAMPWSDDFVIRDRSGSTVGTLQREMPWSDRRVVREPDGQPLKTRDRWISR